VPLAGRRKGCGFEFCYVCRASYNGADGIRRVGNDAHAHTCPYNPRSLPNYTPPSVQPNHTRPRPQTNLDFLVAPMENVYSDEEEEF